MCWGRVMRENLKRHTGGSWLLALPGAGKDKAVGSVADQFDIAVAETLKLRLTEPQPVF